MLWTPILFGGSVFVFLRLTASNGGDSTTTGSGPEARRGTARPRCAGLLRSTRPAATLRDGVRSRFDLTFALNRSMGAGQYRCHGISRWRKGRDEDP
jgi:hypothetical protein